MGMVVLKKNMELVIKHRYSHKFVYNQKVVQTMNQSEQIYITLYIFSHFFISQYGSKHLCNMLIILNQIGPQKYSMLNYGWQKLSNKLTTKISNSTQIYIRLIAKATSIYNMLLLRIILTCIWNKLAQVC